jgi:PAS domain S-box-containing protein
MEKIFELDEFLDKASIISKADANGKITYVNQKFCDISGYTLEEVIGLDHNIVNSGEHPKEFWSDMYRTVVKEKKIWNAICTNRAKDGSLYYVDTFIKCNFDEDGKLLGFMSIRQDVTKLKRTEQEVSNRIKDMLEQEKFLDSSAIISKADSKGKITYVNQKFTDVSGYTLEEVLGKDHNVVNSGTHSKDFWSNMYKTVVVDKGIWNSVCTNRAKDGSLYYVDTFIKCSFDSEGKLLEFMSIRQDVTGLKTKENEIRNRMNAINQSNAVIEFDLEGNIQFANHLFLKTMGYNSLKEISGKHHSIFVEDEFIGTEEYRKFWETLRTGQYISGEITRKKKDGELIYLQATYNPIIGIDGNPYRVMKIATDITESFNQQKEIEKKNTYLEHAAKILRHDMHSGINTYMPRGLSSLERRLSEEQAKELKIDAPLRMIKEGLRHTQKVYKGVYEFTNLVKKDVVLNKSICNLKDILEDYLSATAYRPQVIMEDLGEADVNESLFCTSIDNLIRNGLKYNDSASKFVKIYRVEDLLYIEDNGRGLSQSDFDHLSKPYVRKKDQKESGSGLGLNICIAILEEHGFSITCDKLPTIGTQIKININQK